MIQFVDVSRSYNNKPAVSNLTFNVKPGRITGLLGPNGAGKTTTIRLLLEILPPDSGKILIDGSPVNHNISSRIGYVPEERGFYKREKILDVFKYLSGLRGGNAAESRQRLTSFNGALLKWQQRASFAASAATPKTNRCLIWPTAARPNLSSAAIRIC